MNAMLLIRALVLLLLAVCGIGKITETQVRTDARAAILLSKPFGFGSMGHLTFRLSGVKVLVSQGQKVHDYTNLGFFIFLGTDEIAEDPTAITEADEDPCKFTSAGNVRRLVTFSEPAIQDMIDSDGAFEYTVPQDLIGNGGLVSLMFTNCEANVHVSFDIEVDMYNSLPGGGSSYLSVGEIELPTMYLARLCSPLSVDTAHPTLLACR